MRAIILEYVILRTLFW